MDCLRECSIMSFEVHGKSIIATDYVREYFIKTFVLKTRFIQTSAQLCKRNHLLSLHKLVCEQKNLTFQTLS